MEYMGFSDHVKHCHKKTVISLPNLLKHPQKAAEKSRKKPVSTMRITDERDICSFNSHSKNSTIGNSSVPPHRRMSSTSPSTHRTHASFVSEAQPRGYSRAEPARGGGNCRRKRKKAAPEPPEPPPSIFSPSNQSYRVTEADASAPHYGVKNGFAAGFGTTNVVTPIFAPLCDEPPALNAETPAVVPPGKVTAKSPAIPMAL